MAAIGAYLVVVHWTPERQIRNRQASFLKAVSSRDWLDCQRLMADDYRDQWGFGRDQMIDGLRQVSAHFFVFSVTGEPSDLQVEEAEAILQSKIRMDGSGPGAGTSIPGSINRLKTPFIFTWIKVGEAPWAWKLQRIENEDFKIPRGMAF
ncbi:MAG: hypothetical protein AAF514_05645 [Verrucomicrobiota bacterium]